MEQLTIRLSKSILFDRCHTEIALRGQYLDVKMNMTERDLEWFDVALNNAIYLIEGELARIARDVEVPVEQNDTEVVFRVTPNHKRQAALIGEAIERAIISEVVNLWYAQRLGTPMADTVQSLIDLKHITLMGTNKKRKPNF